ncbi:thioredoxin domain-containing protein [Lentzea sp. BCCO 10_0798]|uniref:Thioredoxin domain-containing protein n=1 Tax=Lentzea kristufekii TaxID=3095430 RepID=A0ABU4U6N7_9PSEU|nr:thioredoxin domain-containing protein [Lentzea sp. BCCO 10_0798]MDX8056171.1 thioredoxin domain-containing protein [Lentzea sp. BCCO 10_0798]
MARKKQKKHTPVTKRPGMSLNVVLATVVVVLASVVFGGIAFSHRGDDSTDSGGTTLVPAGANALSTANEAEVTIVEFLDFQCPACVRYYNNVARQLEEDYRGRITFITRNLPLEMHPLALPAARASEAAARQGKYRELYHALYDNFEKWARDGKTISSDEARAVALFEEFARAAGIDVERFRADMASPEVKAAIDRDIADAGTLGVTSTPTFFFNGAKFEPTGQSYGEIDRELRAKIDAALA